MNDVAYIVGGWAVALGAIGLYGASVVARGRRLSRLVPEDRRRWMTADVDGTR